MSVLRGFCHCSSYAAPSPELKTAMDRNFARALPLVLKHEGGFIHHPNDPGGATNKGVTLATFRAYVKLGGTVEDLKRITDDQVATVYYRHY